MTSGASTGTSAARSADDFYYMVGGYITSSPGLRDAGYNSDEGNQFTINLTRMLERGKVNVFYRQTDDYGQWYLPVALNVPGVDAGYNQLGSRNRVQEIITENSGPLFANGGDPAAVSPTIKTLDLDEGRGWKGSVTGGSVVLDISDAWTLTDRFSLTTGDANTTGLVPDGGAVQVGALLADPAVDARAVVTGPITGAVTGRAIGADEFIQQFGAWEVLKDVDAFTNDISLTWDYDRGIGDIRLLRVECLEQRSLGAGQFRVPGRRARRRDRHRHRLQRSGGRQLRLQLRYRRARRCHDQRVVRSDFVRHHRQVAGGRRRALRGILGSITRSTKDGQARSISPRPTTCPRPRIRRP